MGSEWEEDVCWICLCSSEGSKGLHKVCGCPRQCHPPCLARWQLQQAGKREERYCRFCGQEYPDWKNALTPREIKPTTPIMAVSVRGRVHKLRVRPGPDGKEDFKRQVRQLLGYSDDMEFDVIFECKTPHNGEKVQLQGFSAFDAATHCAAVSAAKRLKNKQQQKQHKQPRHSTGSADTTSCWGDAVAPRDAGSSAVGAGGNNTGLSNQHLPVADSGTGAAAARSSTLMDPFSRVEAQLEHFRQLQQQRRTAFGLAGTSAPSGLPGDNSNSSSGASSSSAASPTSRAYSEALDIWNSASLAAAAASTARRNSEAGAAGPAYHMPTASRSVSNASADASAMLTGGGGPAGAHGPAAAAGGMGITSNCPLPALSLVSAAPAAASIAAAAAAHSCGSHLRLCSALTEPLPAMHHDSELVGVGSGGPGASHSAAAVYETVVTGTHGSSSDSCKKVNKFTRWFQKITTRQK